MVNDAQALRTLTNAEYHKETTEYVPLPSLQVMHIHPSPLAEIVVYTTKKEDT